MNINQSHQAITAHSWTNILTAQLPDDQLQLSAHQLPLLILVKTRYDWSDLVEIIEYWALIGQILPVTCWSQEDSPDGR